MKVMYKLLVFLLLVTANYSCLKDIDTEPIPRTLDETFTVQQSIKRYMSYYRFYKNTVVEVDTALYTDWDLAFESAGEGNRVLPGWAIGSTVVGSGKYEFSEISQELILAFIDTSDAWSFTDPSYINTFDSCSLKNWEDGEIYIQNRGRTKDNYYVLKFISRTDDSYTFKYASAQSLEDVKETTVYRSEAFNYVYFNYNTESLVTVEPNRLDWDLMFSPYLGWWESTVTGEFSPYTFSGALINNETGVRIAHVFDPEVAFQDISYGDIENYEFTDMKGAVGSNWKLLGPVGSVNLYVMDSTKKYILKKYDSETMDEMYFKFQFVDYKLDGEDHHPTVEFKFLDPDEL